MVFHIIYQKITQKLCMKLNLFQNQLMRITVGTDFLDVYRQIRIIELGTEKREDFFRGLFVARNSGFLRGVAGQACAVLLTLRPDQTVRRQAAVVDLLDRINQHLILSGPLSCAAPTTT